MEAIKSFGSLSEGFSVMCHGPVPFIPSRPGQLSPGWDLTGTVSLKFRGYQGRQWRR
jgi:hypothetical protein